MKFPLGDHAQLHTRKGQEYAHAFFFSYLRGKWRDIQRTIELRDWTGTNLVRNFDQKEENKSHGQNELVSTKLIKTSGSKGINFLN